MSSPFSNLKKTTYESKDNLLLYNDAQIINPSDEELKIKLNFIENTISSSNLKSFKQFALSNYKLNIDNTFELETTSFDKVYSIVEEFNQCLEMSTNLYKGIDSIQQESSNIVLYKCKLLNKTSLNYVKPIVKIENPIIVEPGIFQSNYILYDVVTQPLNWTVKRRFSDFENLRLILLKFFPGSCIPTLIKTSHGSKFDDENIKKRMTGLNMFLDYLLESESYKAHVSTYNFLYLNDREAFDNKTSELLNESSFVFVDEYLSLTSEVELSYEEISKDTSEKWRKSNSLLQEIITNIHNDTKKLELSMREAHLNLDSLQKNFNYLSILYKNLKSKEYSSLFKYMEEFIKSWKKGWFTQMSSFSINIKSSLKYCRFESTFFNDLISKRDETRNIYMNEKIKLDNEKETLWNKKDISKWEFNENLSERDRLMICVDKEVSFKEMLYKRTNINEEKKRKFGFYNFRVKEEFRNMLLNQIVKTKYYFKAFLNEFYSVASDAITYWGNFNMYLD